MPYLAVDPDSGEILACELTDKDQGDPTQVKPLLDQVTGDIASVTADGTYDDPVYRAVAERAPEAEVIIPPRATLKPGAQAIQAPTQRGRHIQTIAQRERLGWQRATSYNRRYLGETAMFRYKTLIGRRLRARSLPGQMVEAWTDCAVINRMTRLGRRRSRPASPEADENLNLPSRSARIDDLCTNTPSNALTGKWENNDGRGEIFFKTPSWRMRQHDGLVETSETLL